MLHRATITLLAGISISVAAIDPTAADLNRGFTDTVHPFVETYCVACHGKEKPKADLDLSPFTTMRSVVEDNGHWQLVLEKLEAGEMPPKKAKAHPTAD